jgi:ubiquinone/menaquinone biosynthesis C-methylase UbiE
MSKQARYWDSLSPLALDASVLDPNDRLGEKNRYIAELRNSAIVGMLQLEAPAGTVLDLGCGTGSLSSAIAACGRTVLGLDISPGLLARTAQRGLAGRALFAVFDGASIPVRDDCIAAVTTYVVLNHVLDEVTLSALLTELRRVLAPDGVVVAIEQVRARDTLDLREWKHQRTLDDFVQRFGAAGLLVQSAQVIRYGHFPTTPLVRLGWVPRAAWPLLHRAERALGRTYGVARRDYCDVLFMLKAATR